MARNFIEKIFQQSFPDDEYLWDHVAKTRMGKYLTGIEIDFISQCLSALPQRPEIILDTGAGSGRFEPMLTQFASQVIATEVDPALISRLGQLGDKVVPLLVKTDSISLPFPDAHLDVVISIEVAGLAEKEWFYAEFRRVLKPGGTMITLVTNRNSWKGVMARLIPWRYDYGPESYYRNSLQDMQRWLKNYGLDIRRAAGLNWVPFMRGSNNPLVGFLAGLEKGLLLRRLVHWSPWVLMEIHKI